MLTIGTAGHIDHGKSSLVKALTEIDPDRLPEEKIRGMTLDLGFAWLKLPSGEKVGIIDVPGHEHFVRNVIPGMSGIDGVILLVAADDGWMPQTEEHMQIINLLGIENCIIALNKVDLAADEEWLELVEADINERLKGTSLEGSPIIRLSARDGTGVNELKEAISSLVLKVKAGRDIGKARLPVDRVFIIKGSGVVVTGTLHFGALSSGDDVVVLPANTPAHIRSVECYKETSKTVEPGCRVALNLSGVKREDLGRGDVIVPVSGDRSISKIINTRVSILPNSGFKLKNGEEVLVYIETGEYISRVTLMEGRELVGGETGFVQLKLDREAPVYIGQRLIVRRQSPADTIGGGVVLDPFASVFKTRNAQATISWLERRVSLQAQDLVLTELEKRSFIERNGLLGCSNYSDDAISLAVDELAARGTIGIKGGHLFYSKDWQARKAELAEIISLEHRENPLKRGITQAGAQVKLGLPREIFAIMVEETLAEGIISREGEWLALPDFSPGLSDDQKAVEAQIMALFKASPFSPPSFKELAAQFSGQDDVIYYLLDEGSLVQLSEGILLEKSTYEKIKSDVTAFLKANGKLAIQDMNKLFGLTRKYSIPVLGQLDKEKVTRREGDARVLA
ncbi:MAG: selenocysteine-specific translation elongation factor [Dehalococcoidales bacterium]|jgi:selenocysteine-specific elongation factor|nr:selenocysteine-specific translation elongation factor [Dehalococcoidales bacterium]MDD3264451.1 selenocysteine-specific translation elongation factor [Dehalococcoidales bacterium]MDD4322452.1 selenocysteine-specific translation elongation factor [Dehalococcoidales bacterium]MDD4793972.1 selenocysteine-specific translation elongation factor [Dehalococcoidales bacterium]MDD5498360.1 selenocysteine-specific translation elongation factor [Dehalococcoidales bacterium]